MSKRITILRSLLVGLVVVAAVFVGVVAAQPDHFKVERSAVIAAPASVVFAQVNDFHNWEAWSPYEKLDPSMKRTVEGSAGVGSTYSWDGNDQVGAGRMTLLESKPDESIRIKLEFHRPMEDVCMVDFTFKPEGSPTRVTWIMSGNHTFFSKAICMFMSMDKMIGGDFEKGLAQLKAKTEAEIKQVARQDSPGLETAR